MITGYNGATHSSAPQGFIKHDEFDKAVNNSPAYHAFDENPTTQWVSHSNTYNTSTGVYVGSENLGPLTTSGNADDGEYLKIDLGSAITADTLNLKAVAEYKEPRINMTALNQCGYVVTESSSNPILPHAYELFNSLTTPSTDSWESGMGTYNISTGNHAISTNLGTDFPSGGTTVDGEYVAITLPDKRKLLGYKLTKEDGSTDDGSPKEFKLYARENSTSAWVLLNSETLTTGIGEYVSGDVNTGGTRFPSAGDLTPTTAYQTYALVVEKIFTSGSNTTVRLSEFQLFCQPAEIENFKLYGSPDNSSWTEILHQSTSANITSSGTEFTITNPASYQYYGLVVTKNGGYHNVSLCEMKLAGTETVDLSNYYTKQEVDTELSNYYTQPQVNALLPKGVRAEGSFWYQSNSSSTWSVGQVTFFANSSNVSFDSTYTQLQTSTWGHSSYWAYAPNCTVLQYRFNFTSPILDDTGDETNEYKVMLQAKEPFVTNSPKIISLEVITKSPNYFEVLINLQRIATNNWIISHEFDFVVF